MTSCTSPEENRRRISHLYRELVGVYAGPPADVCSELLMFGVSQSPQRRFRG